MQCAYKSLAYCASENKHTSIICLNRYNKQQGAKKCPSGQRREARNSLTLMDVSRQKQTINGFDWQFSMDIQVNWSLSAPSLMSSTANLHPTFRHCCQNAEPHWSVCAIDMPARHFFLPSIPFKSMRIPRQSTRKGKIDNHSGGRWPEEWEIFHAERWNFALYSIQWNILSIFFRRVALTFHKTD